jgi:2-aminoethylphosphonate-pyruvate transaminase
MQKIETAVFLSAGLGSRLKELGEVKPKGFLEIGSKSLIEQSVNKLLKAGIKKFYFGTGHLDHVYNDFASNYDATCIKNAIYADTGSMYTLFNMRNEIKDDFLLLEADLLYDQSGLDALTADDHNDAILASGKTNSGDEVFIETDDAGNLVNLSKDPKVLSRIDCELVGISKVSYNTYRRMCNIAERMFLHNPKLDYEYVLVAFSKSSPLFVKKIKDYIWCEIDDEKQYQRAIESIFPKIQ